MNGVVALLVAVADPPISDVAEEGARVTLVGQKGELDLEHSPATLAVGVLVRNSLAVPVAAVEVGVLFGATEEVLRELELGRLYQDPTQAPPGVGVVRRKMPVRLLPHAEAPLTLETPVRSIDPDPRVFRTHVLGYILADVSGPLLLDLLRTEAAADEVAAVESLALAGDAVAKRAVRERWAGRSILRADLQAVVTGAIPDKPSQRDTMTRVYTVLAEGVLGGELAEDALQQLLADPGLSRFDEPLQVLRVARLVGSMLETPLAMCVPLTVRRMADLVAMSLQEAGAVGGTGSTLDGPAAANLGASAERANEVGQGNAGDQKAGVEQATEVGQGTEVMQGPAADPGAAAEPQVVPVMALGGLAVVVITVGGAVALAARRRRGHQ